MTRTLCPPLCMWWLQAGFADAGEASMWKTWKKTKLLYYTKYTEFNLNFRHSLRQKFAYQMTEVVRSENASLHTGSPLANYYAMEILIQLVMLKF